MRAGRFDIRSRSCSPTRTRGEAILQVSFRNLKVAFEDGDFSAIGAKTGGYSGADLRELVRIAQRHGSRRGIPMCCRMTCTSRWTTTFRPASLARTTSA